MHFRLWGPIRTALSWRSEGRGVGGPVSTLDPSERPGTRRDSSES